MIARDGAVTRLRALDATTHRAVLHCAGGTVACRVVRCVAVAGTSTGIVCLPAFVSCSLWRRLADNERVRV
jgi:hypothetical protein